jgi:ubiquinone/menaquinone biosynthesis C-methylase UbiE
MSSSVEVRSNDQRRSFEDRYGGATDDLQQLHVTADPLVRFLRDRRLDIGFRQFLALSGEDPASLSVLVICAGLGGEGTFFVNRGCGTVFVADFSLNAMAKATESPGLVPLVGDAEQLPVGDRSVDLVVVQDGLHHLRRPTVGFTEMLRVARRGVLMVEPHTGAIATALGTRWEQGVTAPDVVNFVFRWDRELVEQVLRSYLLKEPVAVRPLQLWDHRRSVGALAERVPAARARLPVAKVVYGVLQRVAGGLGNQMVAVIVRDPAAGVVLSTPRLADRVLGGLRRLRPRPPYAASDDG